MLLRHRNQVVNVVSAIVLGFILCAFLFLAVLLFLSPTLQ